VRALGQRRRLLAGARQRAVQFLAPVGHLRREGLILPWMRAGHLGRVHEETATLLAVNSDNAAEFREDLAVQLHALGLGRGALEEALDRFGDDCLRELADVAVAGARRAIQQILGKLESEELVGRAAPFIAGVRRDAPHPRVRIEALAEIWNHGVTPAMARASVRAALREVVAVESPTLFFPLSLRERAGVREPRPLDHALLPSP